eukprot:PITA_08570
MIQKLVEKCKIHHRITTPYRRQENGQVESTNKDIEGILTNTVANHRRNWANKLPEVLWAYRTTWRNNMGFSSYELVYGKNPLFPIEFEIKTLRMTLQDVGWFEFFQRLEGSDGGVVMEFMKNLEKNQMKVSGLKLEVTEEVISQMMTLPIEGKRWFNKKVNDPSLKDDFLQAEEQLVKKGRGINRL